MSLVIGHPDNKALARTLSSPPPQDKLLHHRSDGNRSKVLYEGGHDQPYDKQRLLEIANSFLELSGNMIVYAAISTREATLSLEGGTYGAILSDYQMLEMDGTEFLSFLMSQGENVPFILFTGKGREEVIIRTLSCGAVFYLQKGM